MENGRGPYEVWADGSGTTEGNPGGWGAIVVSRLGDESEYSGRLDSATNNTMELAAILHGLEQLQPDSAAIVYTDSECAIKWLRGEYRRKNPAIVEYCERIEQLVLSNRLMVSYRHIRGHSGWPLNERCHDLANAARLGATR